MLETTLKIDGMKQSSSRVSRVTELAARYGSDVALGVVYDDEAQASLLPNGGYASSCGDCAHYIQSCEPDTEVVGFWTKDNPTWAGAGRVDGHDFALVEGRYIVDPWVVETECLSTRSVFDLRDSSDQAEIRRIYGDRSMWRFLASP